MCGRIREDCRCLYRFWVSADPAALFAAFEAVLLRSVREAEDAALALVSFEVRLCAKADPAADLAAFDAFGLRRVLDAADAARRPVRSLFFVIGASLFLTARTATVGRCRYDMVNGLKPFKRA